MTAIFHLSLPVRDLAAAKTFYVTWLDARIGRDTGEWADLFVFGHQLTLHQRPDEVLDAAANGVRHFGAILPWDAWQALAAKLAPLSVTPRVSHHGTPQEQGKLLLRDPSAHLIEIKAYRDAQAALAWPAG